MNSPGVAHCYQRDVNDAPAAGASPMYSKLSERLYQSGSGGTVKGRSNGLKVSSGSPPYDYGTLYWYDSRGRLNRLSGPGTPWNYVNYLYLADSDLVSRIACKRDASTSVASTIRSFASTRELVCFISPNMSRNEIVRNRPMRVMRKGATRTFPAEHHALKGTPFEHTGHRGGATCTALARIPGLWNSFRVPIHQKTSATVGFTRGYSR